MPLAVVAAALAAASALPLLWWALASGRASPNAAVVRNLNAGRGPADLRQLTLARPAGDRTVRPLLGLLARVGRRLTPGGLVATLGRRLALAGSPADWPLERVLAAKVLLGAAGGLVAAALLSSGVTAGRLGLSAGVVALGYFAPDLVLYSRGAERQKTIQLELPDTLDQMTISVEAGLGFESAMAQVAQNSDGPLAREFVRALQELQVGVSRRQAFRNLAERTTVDDLRHFVLALVQAESYGIPVADVLRTQAGEMRVKRRQRAEEQAMKIPVKVVFPLVLCILPTLFIVILGPAAIRISQHLFGSGAL